MKRIAIVLAFAMAAPVWAQEQKPAPKEPEKEPVAEKKEPARMASKKRQEDARHCLEKATNTEIIKCSEEYL
jgi:hypothetical protein